MVDGINGVSNIKPKDLTINWNDLTADEVMEYRNEGQEVPAAILTWATDMAKTENSDEITYEMSQGEPTNEVEQIEEPTKLDAGSTLKKELDAKELTPMEQANIFAQESDNHSNQVVSLEADMETILQKSETQATTVEEHAITILDQIQTLRAKQEEIQADKTSTFSPMQANQIEMQIKQLGALGLSEIDNLSAAVYSATNGIGDAINTADDTTAIGQQAISIGSTLAKTVQREFVTPEILAGFNAIEKGNNAVSTAAKGKNIFNTTADDNKEFETRATESKNSVVKAAGTRGIEKDESTSEETPLETAINNEAKENATEQMKADEKTAEAKADLDPTLADTTITTDPNEILKRKERKGLA